MNQARFEGFPLLGEAAQGLLWKITGRAESANLVAFSAVPLFAWFVKRRFDVPMYATILALLAVPLVQIHATSCYVDLPANAAASALVLLAIGAWADDAPPSDRALIVAGICAAIAANMKALMHPIVGLALVALAWRAQSPEPQAGRREYRTRKKVLALGALALPIIFFTPLKNLVLHHNPYYPVDFHFFGVHMFGPDEPYSSSPVWLEHAPRPVRFFCSVPALHSLRAHLARPPLKRLHPARQRPTPRRPVRPRPIKLRLPKPLLASRLIRCRRWVQAPKPCKAA